jgi:hypothetical protein
VTELSNEPAITEKEHEHPEKTSPATMLISMILLIAGLLLASAMLIQQAQERSGSSRTTRSGFSAFIQKGKSLSSQAKANAADKNEVRASAEEANISTTSPSRFKQFFQKTNHSVRWPKLKLTGFGTSSDGESGFAIINEKHIIVGQQISKATLIEIGVQSVVVEYKGEQKTLTVDPSR